MKVFNDEEKNKEYDKIMNDRRLSGYSKPLCYLCMQDINHWQTEGMFELSGRWIHSIECQKVGIKEDKYPYNCNMPNCSNKVKLKWGICSDCMIEQFEDNEVS